MAPAAPPTALAAASSAPAAPLSHSKPCAFAGYILDGLRRTLGYADLLVKDIPADRFAFMPHPTMNHPAFCIGHLSLYPNRVFQILDRPELIVEKAGYPELFQAGVACRCEEGLYPHKDEIVARYRERYAKVMEVLPSVPDEAFARQNPLEGRMRELFPFVGSAVNFLLNNHNMMHLGQVSSWRRTVGLPAAM